MNRSGFEDKNWLEWTVFAIGLTLTVGVAACLLYEAATEIDASAPSIFIVLGDADAKAGHFAVPVIVENRGDATAESVEIEVVLQTDSARETAHLKFDYVPGHSERRGVVGFTTDPRQGRLSAHPLGYQTP
jgi:uncharacterized protein (TIGR02588 family)